jgi:flagellar secretion chaperone FliS
MPGIAENEYLESQILSADPLELVRLLYRAAKDACRQARGHLAAGRIAERSREISHALAILSELTAALDHGRGQTLSHSLAELYDYMQRCLLEANLRQKAAPLSEVESLLTTLLEGWEQACPAEAPGLSRPENAAGALAGICPQAPYGGYPAAWLAADAVLEQAAHSWSF